MKRQILLSVALVILTALVTAFAQSPRRVQWEYTSETASPGKPAHLNKLGDEGWELVAVQTDGLTAVFFLKRQK